MSKSPALFALALILSATASSAGPFGRWSATQSTTAGGGVYTQRQNAVTGAHANSIVGPYGRAAGSYYNPSTGVRAGGFAFPNSAGGAIRGPNGGSLGAIATPYGGAIRYHTPAGNTGIAVYPW